MVKIQGSWAVYRLYLSLVQRGESWMSGGQGTTELCLPDQVERRASAFVPGFLYFASWALVPLIRSIMEQNGLTSDFYVS